MLRAVSYFFSPDVVIERRMLWIAWAVQGTAIIAMVAIAIFVIDASDDDPSPGVLAVEAGLFAVYLASVAASAALGIKRLQARGRSGWWSLVALVPFVGTPIYMREVGFRRDGKERRA